MRRRDFIKVIAGSAAVWPLAARAQQAAMPVSDATNLMTAFRQGLKEIGYVEGQNVATEYRFAENDRDKLTALVKILFIGRSH